MTRPGWGAYFLGIAEAASARGECTRRKVGAVLVDKDSRVRGVGYNGTLPGLPSCLEGACPRGQKGPGEVIPGSPYVDCIADHAEWNLLRNTPVEFHDEALVYVNTEPCQQCLVRLESAGVAMVQWPTGRKWFS